MPRATPRRVGYAALATALMILFALAVFAYYEQTGFAERVAAVRRHRAILTANGRLLGRLVNAETGQRGYLLTGREQFLEAYNAGLEAIDQDARSLIDLTTDLPEVRASALELQTLIDQQLRQFRDSIALRRAHKGTDATNLDGVAEANRDMDQIRSRVARIDASEQRMWGDAWNELLTSTRRDRWIDVFGVVLLVGLVSSGTLALRKSAVHGETLITSLDQAREELENSFELLRATLYSIGDGVIVTDTRGHVSMMNVIAEDLTGVSERDAQEKPIEEVLRIIDQQTREPAVNPVRDVLRAKEFNIVSIHTLLLSRSGIEIPVDTSSAPVRNRDGSVRGAVLVFRDISRRRVTEERMRQLAAIVENTQDAIVGKSLDGIVTSWNAGAEELFGFSAKEMIGQSIERIIPPNRNDDFMAILTRIRNGERVERYETERLTKDGRVIPVSLTVSPVRGANGSIVGASKIARDLTLQKQMEERLRQAQKMEAIGQLAGGIAHDFNNLLTVINGYAILSLQAKSLPQPVRHQMEQIYAAGEQAAALTQHLLAFSRKQVLVPRVIDLNALIRQHQPFLERLSGEDIQFQTELCSDGAPVEVDPHQIEQVLMNLVSNARDAMPRGGFISFETRRVNLGAEYAKQRVDVAPGSYIMLAVSDTGDGIDRQHLVRIFEPFFTTKELGKGTGLGLSTVYGIVTQSGGHISVYSEPGIGTTFRMYFPVARDPISQLQEEGTIQYKGGSETILLVEDDFRIREYACTVLGELGYKVIEAEDGEDALRIIQETSERFDLMITDVIMPKMNGRELADRLKPVLPHLRVLYISGYTENAIVQRGILEPGLHYLAKPFSPPALAEKVRQIVDSPQVPKSILIIDDDPTLRELMEEILKGANYHVLLAKDGNEAVEICRHTPIDLMITDMIMPQMEGIELIGHVRKQLPHLPIIAISGASSPDILSANLGVNLFLLKPFHPQQLTKAVRSIIG